MLSKSEIKTINDHLSTKYKLVFNEVKSHTSFANFIVFFFDNDKYEDGTHEDDDNYEVSSSSSTNNLLSELFDKGVVLYKTTNKLSKVKKFYDESLTSANRITLLKVFDLTKEFKDSEIELGNDEDTGSTIANPKDNSIKLYESTYNLLQDIKSKTGIPIKVLVDRAVNLYNESKLMKNDINCDSIFDIKTSDIAKSNNEILIRIKIDK